jgi:hypothetical protein
VATRFQPQINAFDQRRLAAGTIKKVALTACRHKLVTMLHAMLKHRTSWQAQEVQNENIYQGTLDNQDSCSARASLRLLAAPEARL